MKKPGMLFWASLVVVTGCTRCGGISNNPGQSINPCVVTGRDGNPIVAWYDNTAGYFQTYVRQWNGEAWINLGSGVVNLDRMRYDNNRSKLTGPSAIVDRAGNPIVAASDDHEIYVWRWDETTWVKLMGEGSLWGEMSETHGESGSPSVTIDLANNPIVAWHDNDSNYRNYEIYVRRWNGTAWVEMAANSATGGGISKTSGKSVYPSMAVDGMGNPFVTWAEDTDGDQFQTPDAIYVRRWDGTAWGEMGTGSASAGGIGKTTGTGFRPRPSIVVDGDGNPIVAWVADTDEDEHKFPDAIYVRRWNGTQWVEIGAGPIGYPSTRVYRPVIAINKAGNPVVAWENVPYRSAAIFVLYWDGTAWGEMGKGSATGWGISNALGRPYSPSMAIDGTGRPVIAWQNSVGLNEEIFIRRWNGKSWIEMGTGSASEHE